MRTEVKKRSQQVPKSPVPIGLLVAALVMAGTALAVNASPLTSPDPAASAHPNTGPFPSARGDANCDREINSVDALVVLQFNAGRITSVACPRAADVNRDGQVDSRDAAVMLQIDAGLCCVWAMSEPDLP